MEREEIEAQVSDEIEAIERAAARETASTTGAIFSVGEALARLDEAATAKYNQHYDCRVYEAARNGNIKHDNRMIDDAMAVCGSPYFKVASVDRSAAEWSFLALFI